MHLEPSHILNGAVGAIPCTCAHSGNAKHSGSVHVKSNRPIANGCMRILSKKTYSRTDSQDLVFFDGSLSTERPSSRSYQLSCSTTATNYSGSCTTDLSVSTACARNIVKSAPNSPVRIGASCSSQGSKDIHSLSPKRTNQLQQSDEASVKSSSESKDTCTCKWDRCGESIQCGFLMDHIKSKHVDVQLDCESFVCLWDGCKVYDKKSCSLSWLERHVLSHSGDKPFRCIVDKCCQRFSTQGALQRHVNSHFNTYQQSSSTPKSSRSERDTPSKLLRKRRLKGKRSRHVRTNDYVDGHTVERLKQHIASVNAAVAMDTSLDGNAFTFQSTVIGQRTDSLGRTMCLLHWSPGDILPNEWVPESQANENTRKTIPLCDLPQESLLQWHSCAFYNSLRYRKHRRK